jgi:hypothetical protein
MFVRLQALTRACQHIPCRQILSQKTARHLILDNSLDTGLDKVERIIGERKYTPSRHRQRGTQLGGNALGTFTVDETCATILGSARTIGQRTSARAYVPLPFRCCIVGQLGR